MSIFTCKISPKCSIKVAHLFVAFCCLFHPHTHINEGDGARGATAPLAWGGRGLPTPLAGLVPLRFSSSLCSSICTCKIGLNCSEMLLPANSVWNFVAFAHLRYLKIVLKFCVEGQAWIRGGVSRAVKASLRLYLKLEQRSSSYSRNEAASIVAAKQQV